MLAVLRQTVNTIQILLWRTTLINDGEDSHGLHITISFKKVSDNSLPFQQKNKNKLKPSQKKNKKTKQEILRKEKNNLVMYFSWILYSNSSISYKNLFSRGNKIKIIYVKTQEISSHFLIETIYPLTYCCFNENVRILHLFCLSRTVISFYSRPSITCHTFINKPFRYSKIIE